MTTQQKEQTDLWTGILLLVISLFVIVDALRFKDLLDSPGTIGPHLVPISVAVILALCGGVLVYKGKGSPVKTSIAQSEIWYRNRTFLWSSGLILVYFLALFVLGYSVSTFLFLFGFARLLKVSWKKSLITAILLTGFVYWIFGTFLAVPLPSFQLF